MKKVVYSLFLLSLISCTSTGMKAQQENAQSDVIAPAVEKVEAKVQQNKIFFDFDSAKISSESKAILKAFFKTIENKKSIVLNATGNCDERGSKEYNKKLGFKRASAVKTYLAKVLGFKGKINVKSNGKEKLSVENAITEEQHAMNRNVSIELK